MPQGFSYAKWDKLELSDDEDFECHPNVDKASMIRWKQAEIYRQRRERQDKIKALRMEEEMNSKVIAGLTNLNEQLDTTLDSSITHLGINRLNVEMVEWDKDLAHDVAVMAHTDRDPRWQNPIPDPFFMKRISIEKTCRALIDAYSNREDSLGALKEAISKLKTQFNTRNDDIAKEIKKVEDDINAKMTSETIHTGFSKTVVSKPNPSEKEEEEEVVKPAKKSVKTKTTEIVTLNPEAASATSETAQVKKETAASSAEPTSSSAAADENDDEEVYITNPRVEEFSKLTKIDASFKFISEHPFIVKGKYSDEILAQAFNLQMKGEAKRAKECVHQSLLIQYCDVLGKNGKDGVGLFFKRISQAGVAKENFLKDAHDTYQRIADRVKVLKQQELEKELEEKRQGEARVKAALQPDGTYKLPITPESNESDVKRSQVFDTLPQALQIALLKQDADEINAFLATESKEKAEAYLKEAASVGLITLQEEED